MAKSTHVTAGVGASRCVNVRVNATTDTMKNNETETNMDLDTDNAIRNMLLRIPKETMLVPEQGTW